MRGGFYIVSNGGLDVACREFLVIPERDFCKMVCKPDACQRCQLLGQIFAKQLIEIAKYVVAEHNQSREQDESQYRGERRGMRCKQVYNGFYPGDGPHTAEVCYDD